MRYKNMILWGYHAAYADCWIRLCESPTLQEIADRENAGWNIRILPPGERPIFAQYWTNANCVGAVTIIERMSETKHSPLPWKRCKSDLVLDNNCDTINDANGDEILRKEQGGGYESDPYDIWDEWGYESADADIDFIIRACNTFPDLLEIVKALAERECEYGNGANCNMLPEGVYRSVCLPCKARAVLAKATTP
jgi:hypothetical protein